jgi:hydrogenase assembly chaperone HypC/HupF
MCVAYPVQVVRLPGDGTAEVDTVHGRARVALFALDGAAVAVGDWLLAHSGIALARLDDRDAAGRRSLLDQLDGGQS